MESGGELLDFNPPLNPREKEAFLITCGYVLGHIDKRKCIKMLRNLSGKDLTTCKDIIDDFENYVLSVRLKIF